MGDKTWKKMERWVGENLFDGAKRNIGSGRINSTDDSKPRPGDVIHPRYCIECKLRQSIAIFRWWDKLKEEAQEVKKEPILVMREGGDIKDTLVTVHWKFFKEMLDAWEGKHGDGKDS